MTVEPIRMGRDGLAALTGFALLMLHIRLNNAVLYPLFDGVLSVTRDINVGATVLAAIAVAVTALYRPAALREAPLFVASALLSVLGSACLGAGLVLSQAPVLCAGAVFSSLPSVWITVATYAACATIGGRRLLVGLPVAYALAYAVAWVLAQGPCQLAVAVLVASPLASLLMTRAAARPHLEACSRAMPQADAQITHPDSFLPLTSRLYVCMFLVTVALGFNLRFGASEGSLSAVLPCMAALLFVALNGVLDGRRDRYDTLFRVALMLIMGGFLLAPLSGYRPWAQMLISAADACTTVLFALVLVSVAARNPSALVTVFAWNSVLCPMGSIVGANVGANVGAFVGANSDVETSFLASAFVALALLGYVFFGLRDFSFAQTIEGVTPYEPVSVPSRGDGSAAALDDVCAEVGASCGLTPREAEVMALLAHGRNNAFIQKELVLSRNTVKSYIKHVYAKLGVHSQQEVIDLVETAASGRPARR